MSLHTADDVVIGPIYRETAQQYTLIMEHYIGRGRPVLDEQVLHGPTFPTIDTHVINVGERSIFGDV